MPAVAVSGRMSQYGVMVDLGEARSIPALAGAAEAAMQAGQLDRAAQLWDAVLAREPGHAKALLHLGQHAFHRGDLARADAFLARAAMADPKSPLVPLNRSFVFQAAGDAAAEIAALTQALTIDPYFLPALLARATYYERQNQPRQAARLYKDVLTVAPADPPAWLVQPLERARAAVEANSDALDRHLAGRLEATRARHAQESMDRFNEAKDVMIGTRKIYTQQPTMLHYPRLPAIAFYEPRDFNWIGELERATDTIRDELLALLRTEQNDFAPYVRHVKGVPLNQWAELNHSPRWSAYFLWSDGKRVEPHIAACPKTASLLETLPLARVPGAAPAAFFSALAPRTLIPPHTGVTNTRLIVHLPLIVPEGCWFRVGNEKREWKEGKVLIFDDTIEHEAWNGSGVPRYVLIFDIWNPYLSAAEQELVCTLLEGVRDYYGSEGAGPVS